MPTEKKSVQDRIIQYATEIGWSYISRSEAEKLRKFDFNQTLPKEQARQASLFFDDILFEQANKFNNKLKYTKEELVRMLSQLRSDISGNREFLQYFRGEKTYHCTADNRDYNLQLINFDSNQKENIFHVTDEFYYFNGHYANRADIVFLINGIPVLVIECKNAIKDEAISIAVDQLRRYHNETPEMMIPEQLFTATESIGFSYGVTWNLSRRNIFNWKHDEVGNLELKVKSFLNINHILSLIKDYILFVEKDEELSKFILKQHQTKAVELCADRALDEQKHRGLIWHTQGSGKTFTIIKTAELLYKAPEAQKPTVIILLDRNELEDQMVRNLISLGIGTVELVKSRAHLDKLLEMDYRGIIVSMIHKFDEVKKSLNVRKNIYVLIDEAHRTTGGDLGTYLMATIPNATLIGFTGTPIDLTAYGKGTFKIFGIDDEKGYLHKYSIADSIKDGTTLPLYYAIAPNKLLVPSETLEKEFFSLAETEGISDIEELNKILQRAVVTKTFLKGQKRIDEISSFIAKHYVENIEPLKYKAFLVAVDREACALYKDALDKYLPLEYSRVVYTSAHNDTELLKKYYLEDNEEKQIRKDFAKVELYPKILIVTEKLLTGYDAPPLYAMYLDKPMRDHTLLQAIARVNRPFEDEVRGIKKPHGFVLDFIGIFDKLEKALSFDSDEVNAIVKDIDLLKKLFKKKIEEEAAKYILLAENPWTDKTTDKLIKYFKDKSKRTEFFTLFKQIEILYEIISPDSFLLPYLDNYYIISNIYLIVKNAFSKRVYVDKEVLRKTENLIKEKTVIEGLTYDVTNIFEINENTLDEIKKSNKPDDTKIINLVKSIENYVEASDKPLLLLSMKEKAERIQDDYEDKQETTQDTLERLDDLIKKSLEQQKEMIEKNFEEISYYAYLLLKEKQFKSPEEVARKIKEDFLKYTYWKDSEEELRELRKAVYFSTMKFEDETDKVEDKLDKIAQFVEQFFNYLFRAYNL